MTKKKKPVLDTEYLYPPVAPGQEPILLQRLPLEERIDRAIEMNLDNLEYERARAEAALATLAAWRASAIQQHIETLGQFIDMTNQRDNAEQRARRLETELRSLESQLSKLEMVYATAQQNASETPCVWHYVDDPEAGGLANAKLVGDCGRTEDWLDFTSRYATPKRCEKCGRPVAIQIHDIVQTQPW